MSFVKKTDILVIGCGIGGSIAALTAADQGAEVLIITNMSDLMEGNTAYAQGGIAYQGPNDSPELFMRDIIEAGGGKCYVPAVELLVKKGPSLVKRLLIGKYGVPFDSNDKNNLDLTTEGAHSLNRVIHVADWTGRAVISTLISALKKHPRIRIMKNTTAVDLLTLSHHSRIASDIYRDPMCVGIYALNQKRGRVSPVFAKETILSTGGLGQIYLHTTNPRNARGDGIALAYRAGAIIINLEYVQFHPTTLYQQDVKRFLITESLRGEGGVLVRKNGDCFMDKIHPQGSLAPRDIVARAIQDVMLTYDEPCVYLDVTHLNADWIRMRFPNVYNTCMEYGIDITKKPIPVVPAAHYSCGGVAVDLQGRTSLDRLWAVGEVSCTGVHGANRLASTSLLEGLVWGYEAGSQAAKKVRRYKDYYFPQIEHWIYEKEMVDPALLYQDWLSIKYTMWNYVGLSRSNKRFDRALHILMD